MPLEIKRADYRKLIKLCEENGGGEGMTEIERLILDKLDVMGRDISGVKDEMTKTRLVMENEISRKIDIIGEGHDFLKQRLDEALLMEKKRESMELELVNQRMDLKKLKEHLNIA